MAMATAADWFGQPDRMFGENIQRYYEYVRDNDLLLTHTLITPQVNRSRGVAAQDASEVAAPIRHHDSGVGPPQCVPELVSAALSATDREPPRTRSERPHALPTAADVYGAAEADVDRFLRSATLAGADQVRLFVLAWDASLSSFAGRQALYEYFFFGDPFRMAGNLVTGYDRTSFEGRVRSFLARDGS